MPRPRVRRTKEERYEELLDAAAKVFSERGYRSATIQDVAGELDMTGAALYHYVGGKEDLLTDILTRVGHQLRSAIDEILDEPLAPEEKLRRYILRHLQILMDDRAAFTLLILGRTGLPERWLEDMEERERVFAAQLRAVLEELGTPRPGVAALALLGMLNWTLRWYDADGPLSLDELADSMFELFTRGALR
jgi:AcrR family transcriptional regulator